MVAVTVGQPDRLAASLAQVIQFGTSRLAAATRLYVNNIRRMKRKDALHTLVIYDSTHGKRLIYPATFAGYHRAAEYLNPLLLTFSDSATNIDHIADFKMRQFLFQTSTLNSV